MSTSTQEAEAVAGPSHGEHHSVDHATASLTFGLLRGCTHTIQGSQEKGQAKSRGTRGDIFRLGGDGEICEELSWDDLCSRVLSCNTDRYLVHQTYTCQSESEARSLASLVLQIRTSKYNNIQYRQRGLTIIGFHPAESLPHLHILHACRWANSTCRCSALRPLRRMGHSRSRARRLGDISNSSFILLTQYVLGGPRRPVLVEVSGNVWELCREVGGLQMESCEEPECQRLVEGCGEQTLRPHPQGISGNESSDQHQQRREGNDGSGPKRKGRITAEEIVSLSESVVVCPPENLVNTDLYNLDTRYLLITKNSPLLINSINHVKFKINRMTVSELFKYQLKKPLYYENNNLSKLNEYYLNEFESFESLIRLLLFQFENIINVKNFLKTMYKFINKELDAKMNTVFIQGPPNSGKNFFCDCLAAFCINVGRIESPFRNNSFPFMNAVKRRINKWNVGVLDPAFNETVLDLMQGNVVMANVKYESYNQIDKTPLLIMSNNNVFPNESRFNICYLKYSWNMCPLLQDYAKKPLPLCVGYLLLWANGDKGFDYSDIENMILDLNV